MTCRESGSFRWAFLPVLCAVLPLEFLPSCGWQTVLGGQLGFILCREGALIVCRTLWASNMLCPRRLIHVPLELALAPRPVGDLLDLEITNWPDRTSLHLPLPPVPVSSSHFAASIVIWCELDLLPVTPELGFTFCCTPPMLLPLTGSLAFGS